MKIIFFGAFLFALTLAQERLKDFEWKFDWVNKQPSNDEKRRNDDYLIQFSNPSSEKLFLARLEKLNNAASQGCTFGGKLEGDPDSFVTVTGGCSDDGDSFKVVARFFSNYFTGSLNENSLPEPNGTVIGWELDLRIELSPG